jgi:hypothetical protein
MPGLSTPKLPESELVHSPSGDRQYHVPDLAAVDKEIAGLALRISTAAKFPDLIAAFRADIDSLLDRRMWLLMTTQQETNSG